MTSAITAATVAGHRPGPCPPRVLFSSYTSEWVGPTNSLLLLLRELRSRHHVAVVLPGDGPFRDALRDEGISHYVRPLDKWSVVSLVRLLRAEQFDVLYANATHGSARNTIIAARLAGVPSICHVRAMHWGKPWSRLWYLRLCSAVVAVSQATAASVSRFVRPEKLFVVYNGVPLDGLEKPPSANGGVRAELGVPDSAPLVVNVSHLCQRKGQHHFVDIVERVHQAVPAVHFCLVGRLDRDSEFVRRLRNELARRGLARCVHLLGFRADVGHILQQASVYAHSAVADPHPRAVIEAMAASLPVVAFAVDGVAETVQNGCTGRLINSADTGTFASAIVELIRRPDCARRMGRLGRARVEEQFTARATATRVAEIISRVAMPGRCV